MSKPRESETQRVLAESAAQMDLVTRHMAPRIVDGRLVGASWADVRRFIMMLHGQIDRTVAEDLGLTRQAVSNVLMSYPGHASSRVRRHLARLLGEPVEILFQDDPRIAKASIPDPADRVNDNVCDCGSHARKCA